MHFSHLWQVSKRSDLSQNFFPAKVIEGFLQKLSKASFVWLRINLSRFLARQTTYFWISRLFSKKTETKFACNHRCIFYLNKSVLATQGTSIQGSSACILESKASISMSPQIFDRSISIRQTACTPVTFCHEVTQKSKKQKLLQPDQKWSKTFN